MKALSRLGSHVGSTSNYLFANAADSQPVVGMGATAILWSDRHAHTVVAVRSARRIATQEDTATRTDKNGMSESQDYSYAPNPKATVKWWTLRKNAAWVAEGEDMTNGTRLLIGTRETYIDPSF